METDTTSIDLSVEEIQRKQKHQSFLGAFRYLFKKIILILLTIFLGTFIVIFLTNRPVVVGMGTVPPQLDSALLKHVDRSVGFYGRDNPSIYNLSVAERQARLDAYRAELIEETGLSKPYFEKQLFWTINALKFDWGRIAITDARPSGWWAQGRTHFNLNEIILQHLPLTVLLVSSSFLLLFILGLPVALFLSQNTHKWYDRVLTWIAPLSSVPSWVIGILLIFIFAVELKWLPAFGTFDTLPPETPWGYIPVVLKHMILPVSAIFISMFFQLVYSWRTVFVTFSNEDYVDLGKAMGLNPRLLRRKFILKPTLPFVITNFSLLLIGFWQMIMALEIIFNWHGIGWLFINFGLPNFQGESMYPGEIVIAISVIVMFAYLLGLTVFILDIVYVLVDPRIRLINKEPTLHSLRKKLWFRSEKQTQEPLQESHILARKKHESTKNKADLQTRFKVLKQDMQTTLTGINRFWMEFRRYPSAMVGLFIIVLLVIGSIYALVWLPYRQIGSSWGASTLLGRTDVPKFARPAWVNYFQNKTLLSTFHMDEQHENVVIQERPLKNGGKQKTIIYLFDYYYGDFPSEINLYLKGGFEEKTPFVSMKWITPDGRALKMPGLSIGTERAYDFSENIPARRLVSENENWEKWFNFTKINTTPIHYLFFADPDSDTPKALNGLYQLRVTGITFEDNSDITTELVMLGQVYGLAGTDFLRRDLSIPLFWGMPFALVLGLFGSLITTILSMVLAATGVWFGGWTDDLIQRLTEINLVLPILMISVLAYAYLGISIWMIFVIVILLSVFGAPLKSFRSVLLQIRESPYIEAAKAYGASSNRIIMKYMVPRIIPVLVPQLIILIPSFVFLEATLGLFNISTGLPTWGTVIYQAATKGALYGSRYWVMGPIILLLLSGFAFSLCESALEKILNPRLLDD